MQISKIHDISGPVALYEKGTACMWEDEYISSQLLQIHLSQETDSASRKRSTIRRTVDWILGNINGSENSILDLGCGPGLYCELLAERGHHVTGVDFSRRSIEYAKKEAAAKCLDIEYICQNYLDLTFDYRFDLVMMIYCDFDVLIPAEREKLLKNVYRALKPGGFFIFDTLNTKSPDKMNVPGKSWEVAEKGFWKDEPYLALSETFHYEEKQIILQQHIICPDSDEPVIYRFWTHYYESEGLSSILSDYGFHSVQSFENLLPDDGSGMHEMVTFYVGKK